MNEPHVGPGRSIDPQDSEAVDRRLRRAFAAVPVPGTPETLRASLATLPSHAARTKVAGRLSAARGLLGALATVFAVVLVGAVFASRFAVPSPSMLPSGSVGPTASAGTTGAGTPGGMTVIPWASATPPPHQPVEPPLPEAQPASTRITAPQTAVIGEDVTFTVALTNLGNKPAVFDPCPSYSEDVLIAGSRLTPPADHDYALNCSAIAGTLAPGATVVLEMRYPIPSYAAAGPAVLLWSMDPGGPFDTGAFGRIPIELVHAHQATSSN
jgi:hypothetical protein